MKYIEIKLNISPSEPWKDIFTSLMADIGCDSFMDGENDNELLCYIPENQYDESKIKTVVEENGFSDVKISYSISTMPDKDWNAEWEAHYDPVLIADRCYIRAPFHPAKPETEFEIVIEPKMSFGTAHHATTSQMVEYLLETDVTGKDFLDMGAGTGVLAILAYKKHAKTVVAIDNDEWAYRNGIENAGLNGCPDMKVLLGDATLLPGHQFDIIMANINRNILLHDISTYVNCLNNNGLLFVSGFYDGKDLDAIKQCCADNGLQYVSHKVHDQWVAAKFRKA